MLFSYPDEIVFFLMYHHGKENIYANACSNNTSSI
jgi:hypothetical protein